MQRRSFLKALGVSVAVLVSGLKAPVLESHRILLRFNETFESFRDALTSVHDRFGMMAKVSMDTFDAYFRYLSRYQRMGNEALDRRGISNLLCVGTPVVPDPLVAEDCIILEDRYAT